MVETEEKDSSGGWEAFRNNFDHTDISNCNKNENLGTVSEILMLVTQVRYLLFTKGKKKKKAPFQKNAVTLRRRKCIAKISLVSRRC